MDVFLLLVAFLAGFGIVSLLCLVFLKIKEGRK